MYWNPERYFGACDNCGTCCTMPGIFLPQELDPVTDHLMLYPYITLFLIVHNLSAKISCKM